MLESIRQTVDRQRELHRDFREKVFAVEPIQITERRFMLQGKVLEQKNLSQLEEDLGKHFPGVEFDASAVKVLRRPENRQMYVCTNYTSLHREPSWLAEMLTGMVFGWRMEVLEVEDNWGFVRLEDGYLGWTYLPYLSEGDMPEPTHIITAPVVRIHPVEDIDAPPVGRAFGGMRVRLQKVEGEWAQIESNRVGWVRLRDLRALDAQPKDPEAIRRQMIGDVVNYTGVPYLWGGISANGIDCSGLAQLIHRLSGIIIRRDADMQLWDGHRVEPPFRMGDLVFFGDNGDPRAITHVSISLGGWNIMHSSRSRNGVYVDNIEAVEHLRDSFAGGARYVE